MDQQSQPQQPVQPAPAPQPAQPVQFQQPAVQGQPYQQPAQPYQGAQPYQPAQPYQQPYAAPLPPSGVYYPVSDRDRTLRMVAFIFIIVSCVINAFLIVPLFWLVPMAWWSWGIYKGKKANTVLFGVLTLIFGSLVSGILLLVSTKDK